MSGEIQVHHATGKTTYALIRNRVGQIWDTGDGAFESYSSVSFSAYPVSLVEQGTASGNYVGTFPAIIPAGLYYISAFEQLGGSPAETDRYIGGGDFQWNGSFAFPLSDLVTSGLLSQIGPVRIARGTMVLNFPFKLVSSTDHVTPFTSGVLSGQVSRDGGAFGALQSGAFTEIGAGWYKIQALTSGDLLANTVALFFTANNISGQGTSDQRDFSFVLQRVSGSL